MTNRGATPSPAAVRLTRRAAVADMAAQGLLCGTLLGRAAALDGDEIVRRYARPLLPVTDAQAAQMVADGLEQLEAGGNAPLDLVPLDHPDFDLDAHRQAEDEAQRQRRPVEIPFPRPEGPLDAWRPAGPLLGGWVNADGGIHLQTRPGTPALHVYTLPPDLRPKGNTIPVETIKISRPDYTAEVDTRSVDFPTVIHSFTPDDSSRVSVQTQAAVAYCMSVLNP